MNIPKYWASETQNIKDSHGQSLALKCWRWSNESLAAAREAARERINTVARTLQDVGDLNRYSYSDRPLREEIIQTVNDDTIITRNGYGALVLNTARVMFIDIDLEEAKPKGLFSKPAPNPLDETKQRLEKWVNRNTGWGMRMYRTKGGVRCIATHELFEPDTDQTQSFLKELESDPLYITLCRQQKCFRARLTPKHWRCDLPKPPARYPFETPQDEAYYRQWVQKYEASSTKYSVCELVAELGNLNRHPEVDKVITLHDQYALANHKLPLA